MNAILFFAISFLSLSAQDLSTPEKILSPKHSSLILQSNQDLPKGKWKVNAPKGNWQIRQKNLQQLEIRAKGLEGVQATIALKIYLDTLSFSRLVEVDFKAPIPPTFTNKSFAFSKLPKLEWKSTASKFTLTINEKIYTTKDLSYTPKKLTEGGSEVSLVAVDSLNNISKASKIKILYDKTPPQIHKVSLPYRSFLSPGILDFTISFREKMDTNRVVTASIAKLPLQKQWLSAQKIKLHGTLPEDFINGTHFLALDNFTDLASNSLSDSLAYKFRVDTKAPEIKPSLFTLDSSKTLTSYASVPTLKINTTEKVFFALDSLGPFQAEHKLPNLSNGKHTIQVWGKDKANNVSQAIEILIFIDREPSEVSQSYLYADTQFVHLKIKWNKKTHYREGNITLENIKPYRQKRLDSNAALYSFPLDSIKAQTQYNLDIRHVVNDANMPSDTNLAIPHSRKLLVSLLRYKNSVAAAKLLYRSEPNWYLPNQVLYSAMGRPEFLKKLSLFMPLRDSLYASLANYYAQEKQNQKNLTLLKRWHSYIDENPRLPNTKLWNYQIQPFQSRDPSPIGTQLLTAKALQLYQQDYHQAAESYFLSAYDMDSSLTATFNLGTYYLKQNQFDKAELLLESTYPEIPSDNYHIALLKNRKTLPQNAFVFSKYNQALYIWGLGKQESAIKILTSIPSAQETLAWMYYSTGQYDNCAFVSDYGKALIAYQTNNTGAAFTHIQKYLHKKPNHLEAWVLLAKLSISKKYWIQAENILTYVLRLSPNFTPALKEIRTVFHQLNKSEKLKAVLLRATEKSHLNKDKNYRLGIKTFKNLSDSSLNWIANSIPQTLTQLFHSESKYNVLERREFQKILTEKGYLQSLDANYQQGLSLGLSHILLGSYQVQGEQIKISARIVETESGKVLESSNVLGHLDSLSYWENQLALQLLGRSKPNLLNQIISLDAKKQNAMAQQFLFEGNVAKAKALSKQAITSDPNILGVMDEVVLTDDDDTKSHVIAVMPFENLTQNAKMQWLSIGAQDALISDLKRYGGLYTIERSQVQSLLEEQALSLSGAIAPESAPKIGALLAAGVTILGSFQTEGDQVKISARLVKVETGDIFLAESVQGSKDEVLSLQQKLAMQLLKGLKISTEQNKKIRRKDPLALKTLSDELKWDTQQQVLTETIVEYRKEQGSHWGASLWTTSILSTAGASLSYYYHLKDDDDYNNATNTSQSTLLGDQAESSYDRSLYLASSALFSWALMGGYYLIFGESND